MAHLKDHRAGTLRRLEVEVGGFGEDGAAVGRAAGEPRPVVVAAGAVPGDRIEAAVEHESRDAVFGRLLRVLAPGAERVAARCPIVAECGGCPWQALAYPAQLRLKEADLRRRLREYATLRHVRIGAVRGLADPYGYRTKIQMPVGGRAGALEVGFYRPHSHRIIEAAHCAVQHPEANRIVAQARAILERARLEPYDERRHAGVLRTLLVRIDGSGRRASLTLVVRTDRFQGKRTLVERLAAVAGVTGVHMNVQPARGNVVLGRRTERLAGRERVLVEVAGKRFLLSPAAFFQTNPEAAGALVERARAHLAGHFRTLVDLYCGVGLFARALAGSAAQVIGVEENPAAVEDAEAGARLDGDGNVTFLRAEAEAFARDAAPADAVIVDPPRAGCAEALLERIARRLRPRRLVYVSCNPATLLRDLDLLARLGFETAAIEPVDMFPHTAHLECVAAVSRK